MILCYYCVKLISQSLGEWVCQECKDRREGKPVKPEVAKEVSKELIKQ